MPQLRDLAVDCARDRQPSDDDHRICREEFQIGLRRNLKNDDAAWSRLSRGSGGSAFIHPE